MNGLTKRIDNTVVFIIKIYDYLYQNALMETKNNAVELELSELLLSVPDEIRAIIFEETYNVWKNPIYEQGNRLFSRVFIQSFLELVLKITDNSTDSYEYIYYITSFVNHYHDKIIYHHLTELYQDKTIDNTSLKFSAYYCAYVYIRKSETYNDGIRKKLQLLYDETSFSTFELYGEIKTNYLKIIGICSDDTEMINQAVNCSKELLRNPKLYNNAAIIATFCDCVICKLETTISLGTSHSPEDIINVDNAIIKIKKVSESISDYSTYFFIYGKLLYLKGVLSTYENIETSIRIFHDAKDKFHMAERNINQSSYGYLLSSRLISSFDVRCDVKIDSLQSLIDNTIVSETIGQKLERKISLRMIELLGFFTAIIALILTNSINCNCNECVSGERSIAPNLPEYYCSYITIWCCPCCSIWIVNFIYQIRTF